MNTTVKVEIGQYTEISSIIHIPIGFGFLFLCTNLAYMFVMQRTQFRGNMNAGNGPVNTATAGYTCGRCTMFYYDYKHLVEHLYWRHGTESLWCKLCGLKKWRYAAHVCNILPIDDNINFQFVNENSNTGYCFCGEDVADAPMIGCDSAECTLQWYHFKCVGIESPPDGDWFCPLCTSLRKDVQTKKDVSRT